MCLEAFLAASQLRATRTGFITLKACVFIVAANNDITKIQISLDDKLENPCERVNMVCRLRSIQSCSTTKMDGVQYVWECLPERP